MSRVRITGPARRDVAQILEYSTAQFGRAASRRYRTLIEQAILDLGENSARQGVKSIDDVREGYYVYHLKWSRKQMSNAFVRSPRHVVVFFVDPAADVVIARLFHERQMLARHLDGSENG